MTKMYNPKTELIRTKHASPPEYQICSLVNSGDDNEGEREQQPVPLNVCPAEGMLADNELPQRKSLSLIPFSPDPNVSGWKSDENLVHVSCLISSPMHSTLVGPERANMCPIVIVAKDKSDSSSDNIGNKDRHFKKSKVENFLDGKSVRRSPRFTSAHTNEKALSVPVKSQSSKSRGLKLNENKEPKNKSVENMEMKVLRRSPRFNSSLSETKCSSFALICSENKEAKNKCVENMEMKVLRKSPRFTSAQSETKCSSLALICSENKEAKNNIVENTEMKVLRRSPRFTSTPSKPKCSSSEFIFSQSKEAKNNIVENMEMKILRRSPRFTSTPSKTKCSSSELIFRSSKKVSYYGTRSSENSIDMLSCFTCPEGVEQGSFPSKIGGCSFSSEKQRRECPRFSVETENLWGNESTRKFVVHKSSFSIEKQVRRSPRISLAIKNNVINGSNRRLETHEMDLSREKLLRLSPTFLQATENVDSNVCFKKHKRDMSSEKPLKMLVSTEVSSSSIELADPGNYYPSKKHKILSADSYKKFSMIEKSSLLENNRTEQKGDPAFVGNPIPDDEAQERWRWRYEMKNVKSKTPSVPLDDDDEDRIVWNVECHYAQAEIDGCVINLEDCVYIKGEEPKYHIGRILEFFKTTDGENYFRVQWFYRAEDTVMKQETSFHDKKRLFYSTVVNDNTIDCIASKVSVIQVPPKLGLKSNSFPQSDFYFDMEYCVEYSTFRTLPANDYFLSYGSMNCYKENSPSTSTAFSANIPRNKTYNTELKLLDLYSGCGGMSTGLCLGANACYINLVTKWAVDSDKSACKSLNLNHPETHVRNEAADDFLQLLKEWENLCKRYALDNLERTYPLRSKSYKEVGNRADIPPGELEVSHLVDICYGDPCKTGTRGLHFKVRWKGYDESEDTWELIEGLSNCQECIEEFVRKGFRSKILPLRGDVDVICGGPPCQGISGYNRFRNVASPLDDERNRQIVVFMDIVEYLKPKFVLMENVVDILRFDKASLGRYALSRLVHVKYQARLGIIAAGCYGLPQFRLRVFLWGAQPSEKLPQFPLPTHDVIIRYWPPPEFERNTVAYDEDQPRELEEALVLYDAISDLPAVANDEAREEMTYGKPPETEFQRFIRSSKYEMTGSALSGDTRISKKLYDHRPLKLFEDDYARVCLIPKRKGANFRDLPGVIVGGDNVARRDPTVEKKLLPSGKPLVPDYVYTFEQGKSRRPFGRLWWDETVPTLVTHPNCHSQPLLHPEQDRILTVREYARLQGFPDYYRFYGTIKERYCQIGNAVAVPVARALGFSLGMAVQKLDGHVPLMVLPPKFSHSTNLQLEKSVSH